MSTTTATPAWTMTVSHAVRTFTLKQGNLTAVVTRTSPATFSARVLCGEVEVGAEVAYTEGDAKRAAIRMLAAI